MRFASAQRRISSRKIDKISDRKRIRIEWSEPVTDPLTKRITGKVSHFVLIKGYTEQFSEKELEGTELSRFDRRLVLDAAEVESQGLVLKNDMYVKLGTEIWNIIDVYTGPYAKPNEYAVLIRKS